MIGESLKTLGVVKTIGYASLVPHPRAIVTFPFNPSVAWTDAVSYQGRYGHKGGGQPADPTSPEAALYTAGNLGEERFLAVFSETGQVVIRQVLSLPADYQLNAQDFEDIKQAAEPGPSPSRSFIDAKLWDKVAAAVAAQAGGVAQGGTSPAPLPAQGSPDVVGAIGQLTAEVQQLHQEVKSLANPSTATAQKAPDDRIEKIRALANAALDDPYIGRAAAGGLPIRHARKALLDIIAST